MAKKKTDESESNEPIALVRTSDGATWNHEKATWENARGEAVEGDPPVQVPDPISDPTQKETAEK
jgi:hypothetical protein